MLWKFLLLLLKMFKQQSNKNYYKYSECQFAGALKNWDSIACQYLSIQTGRK